MIYHYDMEILPFKIENFNKSDSKPLLSLSISVYNNVLFFEKVWASVKAQSFKNFEVIIADDGSAPENKQRMQKLIQDSNIPCTYVWQEDRGFHKNEVLNKGILNADSNYMVFIDGDCVLHHRFLEDHWAYREENVILAGRRANLSKAISEEVSSAQIQAGWLDKNYLKLVPRFAFDHDSMAIRGLRIENPIFWKLMNRKERGVVGCNFSVHRSDLLKVNGFDMRYTAAGTGEDSDIEYRLNLASVKTKPFCHKAIQYHLWHKLQRRDLSCETLFKEVQAAGKATTEYGINLLK